MLVSSPDSSVYPSADHSLVSVARIAEFETVIDVRSPAEFAEDHVPGAINCPVLDDAERALVGTLYTQDSPFAARRVGAVLVARNIARHIEEQFSTRPKGWRPLVYCWRGGQRSAAFTHILREVGWSARRLEGGYKRWRQEVLDSLEAWPANFNWRVLSGPTGSGKSRLLEALAAQGAQVLHLEALAAHRGSVLGGLPERGQPTQKAFETAIYSALQGFSAERPVYVEAESRMIGRLRLPVALHTMMRGGRCLELQVARPARVQFLIADYAHLCDAGQLAPLLERLTASLGRECVRRWLDLAQAGDFPALVDELLVRHYDPLYARAARQYQGARQQLLADDLAPETLRGLAGALIEAERLPA